SWGENDNGESGKLYGLDADGGLLFAVDLPAPFGGSWSGGLSAPTLADIDGDGELEAIVQTVDAGVVAYDLPRTANASLLWPTGRGSYLRAGVANVRRPDALFSNGFDGG